MPSHPKSASWAKSPPAEEPTPRAQPGFPPAMSRTELRALYEQNPTPEVRRLLWEVARLQMVVRRAAQFASCFPLYDGHITSSAYHIILGALRRDLAPEAMWLEEDRLKDEEIFDADPRSARRRERR